MTRNYVSPKILSHQKLEKIEYNKLFYTPRTIASLIATLLFVNYTAYYWNEWLI